MRLDSNVTKVKYEVPCMKGTEEPVVGRTKSWEVFSNKHSRGICPLENKVTTHYHIQVREENFPAEGGGVGQNQTCCWKGFQINVKWGYGQVSADALGKCPVGPKQASTVTTPRQGGAVNRGKVFIPWLWLWFSHEAGYVISVVFLWDVFKGDKAKQWKNTQGGAYIEFY